MKIRQLVPVYRPGYVDGQALFYDRLFSEWGWHGEIVYYGQDLDLTDAGPADLTLLHYHCFGLEKIEINILGAAGLIVPVLHRYYGNTEIANWDDDVRNRIRLSNNRLAAIAQAAELCIGYSDTACDILAGAGAKRVRNLPLPALDLSSATQNPVVAGMMDPATRWLFYSGDVVSPSGVDHLIHTLFLLREFSDAAGDWRLMIAGSLESDPVFATYVHEQIDRYKDLPEGCVLFTGLLDPDEMFTAMTRADAYVTFDSRDITGAAILQAMQMQVPVVARAEAAVPELLGDAGVLLTDTIHSVAAECIARLITSPEWREKTLAAQMRRLELHAPGVVEFQLRSHLNRILT